MAETDLTPLLQEFRTSLEACRKVYARAARIWAHSQDGSAKSSTATFNADHLRDLMDDLHRGLLIKIYVTVAEADRYWSPHERLLAEVLLEHVWGQRLTGSDLTDAVRHIFDESSRVRWSSVVGPFARYEALRERTGELRTVVTRIANLVAKADGTIQPVEQARLASIEVELDNILEAVPLTVGAHEDARDATGSGSLRQLQTAADEVRQRYQLESAGKADSTTKAPAESLSEAIAELEGLVGLAPIKQEIHTLVNFLKVQAERQRAGLPSNPISLHMVFCGNPGTGKTTVARLVGRILGAMGILKKGHLVETDRSGLVASYAGQTGPRTQKKIDEALDGVLFIDEAYSLVSEDREDAYGAEAVQALLKRMEDDRHRLVVILAGYPAPMERLLRSNPGLSSRFSRQLEFPDYTTVELGRLFQQMCDQSRYTMTAACRAKLAQGFYWLLANRDEHFGNGRLVRNAFESATRRMANRIVGIAPLTHELLTQFEVDDIDMQEVRFEREPSLAPVGWFSVACPGCGHTSRVHSENLGRRVRCRKCSMQFHAEWGEPLASERDRGVS